MPSKSPLVLLHGFTATPRVWDPVRPLLEREHELHVPTLHGHSGGAALPAGARASTGALADGIEQEMDAAGLTSAHLCGNSLGGFLALELARRGRARSVVAIAPSGGWAPGSRAERRLFRRFKQQLPLLKLIGPHADKLAARPGLRRLLVRDVHARPERVSPQAAAELVRGAWQCSIYLDLVRGLQEEGPPENLDGISVPVRIAWGSADRILPARTYAPRIRELLPNAEFIELPGLGHVPMSDDPALVAKTIIELTSAAAAHDTAVSGPPPLSAN